MSISAQWGYGHGSSVTPPLQPPCHHAACRQYCAECRHCLTVCQRHAACHHHAACCHCAACRCRVDVRASRREWQKITTEITKNGQSSADQAMQWLQRAARRNQCRCICHSHRPPLTAVNRRHSPPPPRCNWLCASVRKFCWAMVLGCTRLIECSGYFFLVQLTLCTLYNLTKNTTVNVPTKGLLNSEWIYEVIVSPKMPTKHLKDFCPWSLLKYGFCR